jgi:hypothetical protein
LLRPLFQFILVHNMPEIPNLEIRIPNFEIRN